MYGYEDVQIIKKMLEGQGFDTVKNDWLIKVKREARRRNRIDDSIRKREGRYVCQNSDSYWQIVDLGTDDMETAEYLYEEEYRRVYYPSQYDCTGQHFTMFYYFTRTSRGTIQLWQKIGIDV